MLYRSNWFPDVSKIFCGVLQKQFCTNAWQDPQGANFRNIWNILKPYSIPRFAKTVFRQSICNYPFAPVTRFGAAFRTFNGMFHERANAKPRKRGRGKHCHEMAWTCEFQCVSMSFNTLVFGSISVASVFWGHNFNHSILINSSRKPTTRWHSTLFMAAVHELFWIWCTFFSAVFLQCVCTKNGCRFHVTYLHWTFFMVLAANVCFWKLVRMIINHFHDANCSIDS